MCASHVYESISCLHWIEKVICKWFVCSNQWAHVHRHSVWQKVYECDKTHQLTRVFVNVQGVPVYVCLCAGTSLCAFKKCLYVCLCRTFLNWKLKIDQHAHMNATQSRIFYCSWHVLLIVWAFSRISKRANFGRSVPAHCCVLAYCGRCWPEEVLLTSFSPKIEPC